MAELDNIPQKQTVEIASVKLDEATLNNIVELNQKSNVLISDFGQIYIRKKELHEELQRLDEILENAELDFKANAKELRDVLDALDEKYPQGRLNLQEGTVTFQPGAPSRKQLQEQQLQQAKQDNPNSGLKVVKG